MPDLEDDKEMISLKHTQDIAQLELKVSELEKKLEEHTKWSINEERIEKLEKKTKIAQALAESANQKADEMRYNKDLYKASELIKIQKELSELKEVNISNLGTILKNHIEERHDRLEEVLQEIKNQLLYHKLLPSNFDDYYKLEGDSKMPCKKVGTCDKITNFEDINCDDCKEYEQITELKDNIDSNRMQINANLEGIHYCRKFMFNLEEVLRECFDRFPSYNGIDIPREHLKKIDDWRTSMQILLKKLSGNDSKPEEPNWRKDWLEYQREEIKKMFPNETLVRKEDLKHWIWELKNKYTKSNVIKEIEEYLSE